MAQTFVYTGKTKETTNRQTSVKETVALFTVGNSAASVAQAFSHAAGSSAKGLSQMGGVKEYSLAQLDEMIGKTQGVLAKSDAESETAKLLAANVAQFKHGKDAIFRAMTPTVHPAAVPGVARASV